MKYARLAVAVSLFLLSLAGISRAQDQSLSYYQAGNTFYSQKNYDQAIRYYQAAAQMNSQLWQAYQGEGNCYYAKGDKSSALTNYQKALAINPNNPQLSSFTQTLQGQVSPGAPGLPGNTPASANNSGAMAGAASDSSKFELDVNAGLALYSSQVGFGGGLSGYLPLDKSFLLGAGAAFYTVSQSESATGSVSGSSSTVSATASATVNFIELMARAKYVLEGTSMKPYFFGGAGLVITSSSYSYSGSSGGQSASGGGSLGSASDPALSLGGGLAFPGGKDMDFTVQLKENIIFVPGQTVTETVGGVTESVTAGGGTDSYTALEGGINFNI